MTISDQERMWRERRKEREPVYYDYPKTGFQGVILYQKGCISLIQLNDYGRREKTYFVFEDDSILIETKIRQEADTAYHQALKEEAA
jgi:hypothetical protein